MNGCCWIANVRRPQPWCNVCRDSDLRSKVTIAAGDQLVHAAWDGVPAPGAIMAPDPRLPEAGWRILSTEPLAETGTAEDWDRHRLALGLPDGTRDLEAEKTVLLEAGFDELNGISWSKGCYMGQERPRGPNTEAC